ncbi:Flavodoxin, partial [Dysosmobacter welbionis]
MRGINRQQAALQNTCAHIQKHPVHRRQAALATLCQRPPPTAPHSGCRSRGGGGGLRLRYVEHPRSGLLRQRRLLGKRRALLPCRRFFPRRGILRRRCRGRYGAGGQLHRAAAFCGGRPQKLPPLGTVFQPLDPGLQGRQVPREGLVAQPQEAELRIRAAV